MISKKNLENFLRINGIASDAPDGEIKSVLLAARWNSDDVDAAITVLREEVDPQTQHVESLNKLFRSDDRPKPETISSMLGIGMELLPTDVDHSQMRKRSTTYKDWMFIVILSVLLAATATFGVMFHMEMGPFHQTALLYR